MKKNNNLFSNKINHIAFIMDGNRRWAKANDVINFFGYKKGIENLITKADFCIKSEIKFCTFFALSVENLTRHQTDIEALFTALKLVYKEKKEQIKSNKNFKLKIIGDLNLLPKKMKDFFKKITVEINTNNEHSESFTTVVMAVGYGSRNEITTAIKNIINDKISLFRNIDSDNFDNLIKKEIDSIDEKFISQNLQTKDIPDPEILIRTSGTNRLSNFLLWQLSYSELFFIKNLWPDFSNNELEEILNDFLQIKRNFGK